MSDSEVEFKEQQAIADGMLLVPLDKHLTITSAAEVRNICEPLASSLNTPYFNYVRRFTDGSQLSISTDANWNAIFLKNKLYEYLLTDKGNVGCIKSGSQLKIIPWGLHSEWKLLSIQCSYTGISAGMTIINIKPEYTDFYYFGTTCNNPWMREFYLSHSDLFLHFCEYFHEKASSILALQQRKESLIYLPPTFLRKSRGNQVKIVEFLEKTKVNKNVLQTWKGPVAITKKEQQCINWLCHGLTAKGIARKMEISPRTVESHLNKVKNKFSLAKKSDLISFYLKHSTAFN